MKLPFGNKKNIIKPRSLWIYPKKTLEIILECDNENNSQLSDTATSA